MKINGTSHLAADPQTVWRALNDPAVLVRTIPGCRRLEAQGEGAFAMTVAAGVGSVQGVYDGRVRLSEQEEPTSFRLRAEGAGAPGTVGTDVRVRLAGGSDGGTELSYDADATVGGMVGGVGQRMLTSVSKRMADQFFANVDTVLAGGPAPGTATDAGAATGPEPAGGQPGGSTSAAGRVFTAPAGSAGDTPGFVAGAAVGAAAALAGAVIGGWLAGRRRR